VSRMGTLVEPLLREFRDMRDSESISFGRFETHIWVRNLYLESACDQLPNTDRTPNIFPPSTLAFVTVVKRESGVGET
jgi:hypothetical protein